MRSPSHRPANLSPRSIPCSGLPKLTAQSYQPGGPFEEAATPGCPQNAPFGVLPGAFSRNPPAVHPREPPETSALPHSPAALKTSHVCTGGTLLESQNLRNRNFMPELCTNCAGRVFPVESAGKEERNSSPGNSPRKPECLRQTRALVADPTPQDTSHTWIPHTAFPEKSTTSSSLRPPE